MLPKEIENYISSHFEHIHPLKSWGETSFFINPEKKLERGTYFATLKEKDGENDKSSFLNRENTYRLNIGIGKENYTKLFTILPSRPKKGEIIKGPYDFKKTNTILPHPIYGWMGWVCILNPSQENFDTCKKLLDLAYEKAYLHALQRITKLTSQ